MRNRAMSYNLVKLSKVFDILGHVKIMRAIRLYSGKGEAGLPRTSPGLCY